MPVMLPLGPLMIDVAGHELTNLDRDRLLHPLVGGVILFARNYASPEQLSALTTEIHALRSPSLLIAIDHEGGRVQRCREGFTRLPAMRRLGELWERDALRSLTVARQIGYVLACELRSHGVDMSFTPVLDLDWGRSQVIGDRSFHRDPEVVVQLAGELIAGLRQAGMSACGKHFPGHGWVEADSHLAIPVDRRSLAEIETDMQPFRRLALDAIMPAHVIYPAVDERPAGFSPRWIDILRREIGFGGVVFSDDLSMEGASVAGGIVERVEAAWRAGCDMLLVCNAPDKVSDVLEHWRPVVDPAHSQRIVQLGPDTVFRGVEDLAAYQAGVDAAGQFAD